MDDRHRLLRLVSLVAWTEPGSFGLRFATADDELWWYGPGTEWADMLDRGKRPSAPEVTAHIALGTLAACYARAAERLSDPAVGGIDAQEFPGVAYYAVVSLSDDVLAMLGRILRARLNLPLEVNDVEVAQRWVDDVRATAWSTLVAEQGDHFGRHIAPRVGQRHNA